MNEKHPPAPVNVANPKLRYDLGTFAGYNPSHPVALRRRLTAQDVVDLEHKVEDTAEFRPAGDRFEIRLIFGADNPVSAAQLRSLDRVLQDLGGDSIRNYLHLHSAIDDFNVDLATATARDIEHPDRHLFIGDDFFNLRDEAADALLAYYWPEGHSAAQTSRTAGLFSDSGRVLQWMMCTVEEVDLGDQLALIVVRHD